MTLEKVLRYVALAGVFALPFVALVVTSSLFFPYITGKNFTFRIIVEIMTGAYLALCLVNPAYRPRRSWILGAFALFVLLVGLADAFGAAPFKSFWSNFERMDGWITLIHVLLYLVVASSMMTTERLWRWLWWITLGVSVYLALYGFLQVAGIAALGQGGQAGFSARIDATFGNPIYFAVYMLFHVFIAAQMWVHSWNTRARGTRLAPSIVYGTIIVLDTFALLFTGTRGAMLGLIGGAILAALLYVWMGGTRRLKAASVVGLIAVIVLGIGLYSARNSSFVQNVGFLQRLATISLTDATVKARFLNWGIAWQGVKERPLLGWGQENYAVVFNKYYDPRMYGQEPWFDRVHNVVFDWLVAGGILGFAAYVSVFVATLLAIWRRRGERFSLAEKSILTGLLAGYTCHNFFVFDNITSYILFGSVLAYVVSRADADLKPVVAGEFIKRSWLPAVALAAVVITWGAAWYANADALRANRALIRAISQQTNLSANLAHFDDAISTRTMGAQEAREQLVQGAVRLATANIPAETKQQFLDVASRAMLDQADVSPLDARFPLFLGTLYRAYGDYERSAEALARAQELAPRKQMIFTERAQTEMSRKNYAKALEYMKTSYELAPDIVETRILYAATAIYASEFGLAETILQPLVESGEAAHPRILAAYVERNRHADLIRLWSARVKAMPQDLQSYITLAAVYYDANDRVKAIEVLESAKAIVPGASTHVDPLIEQIRAGTANVR